MTRAEMLSELKQVLRETTYDAAWGDALLLSYLAEGQDKFCEDTGYFVDSVNYPITTVIGQANYELDERIIQVLEIYNGSTRLGKFQQYDMFSVDPTDAMSYPTETSDSYGWQADKDTGFVTLYPVPTTVRTLNMRVHRYSRVFLADGTAQPEIPARFHRAPIHWAAFRSLTHHDMEQQDGVKASDHLQIYTDIKNQGRTAFERISNRRVGASPNPLYLGVY